MTKIFDFPALPASKCLFVPMFNTQISRSAFSGFEDDNFLPTGIMASEKGGKWAIEMLSYYDGRSFLKENGEKSPESLEIPRNCTIPGNF